MAVAEAEADEDEESEEEETGEEDQEVPDPPVPAPATATEPGDRAFAAPAAEAAKASGAEGEAPGEDGRRKPRKSKDKSDHDLDPSRTETPALRSQRPPEPVNGPRTATVVDSSPEKDDRKHGKYDCRICGRTVGGGEAGSFQHRRSAYHLASWVYWQNQEARAWKDCLTEGHQWSKTLWAKNSTGPSDEDFDPKTKKQKAPPPIRSDPEMKRRDQGPGPGRDGSGGGPDSATTSGSSKDKPLLLQMWQATLRELK